MKMTKQIKLLSNLATIAAVAFYQFQRVSSQYDEKVALDAWLKFSELKLNCPPLETAVDTIAYASMVASTAEIIYDYQGDNQSWLATIDILLNENDQILIEFIEPETLSEGFREYFEKFKWE